MCVVNFSSKSLGGAEYFVTFIDDKTRYVWAYAIKRKSDVFQKFCEWKLEVEKSLGQSVKILRTDNGGEFTSDEFENYFKREGIKSMSLQSLSVQSKMVLPRDLTEHWWKW